MPELGSDHQNFLGKYFKADEHYTKDESPLEWLKNSSKVTHRDIDKALDNEFIEFQVAAASSKNASSENLYKALQDNKTAEHAVENPNATKEHLDFAINGSRNYRAALAALKHKNLSRNHLDDVFSSDINKNRLEYDNALQNPNVTSDDLTKVISNNDNWTLSLTAVRHPKITKQHLDMALRHENPNVRIEAIKHKKATKEHLMFALKDHHFSVRESAKKSRLYKKYFSHGHQ